MCLDSRCRADAGITGDPKKKTAAAGAKRKEPPRECASSTAREVAAEEEEDEVFSPGLPTRRRCRFRRVNYLEDEDEDGVGERGGPLEGGGASGEGDPMVKKGGAAESKPGPQKKRRVREDDEDAAFEPMDVDEECSDEDAEEEEDEKPKPTATPRRSAKKSTLKPR